MPVDRGSRRSPSVRGLVLRLLLVLGLLLVLLVAVMTLQVRGSNYQTAEENRRIVSLGLADSMRQSSNDLTRMVQLYVSTGQPEYRTYYNQILAIRAGTAPRPLDYTNSFWDEVLADGFAGVKYGPPQSLVEQMRAADFTPQEFDALNASLRASNQLAQVELDVMNLVAPRIADGVNGTYQADVAPQYRRLVDPAYLAQKGVIMRAVEQFTDLVNATTLADVNQARTANRRLLVLQFGILAVGVLVALAALRQTRRSLLGPLSALAGVTRVVADGDYGQRAEIRAVSELEGLAGAFNDMAAAIESDIAGREEAEREAVEARQAAEHASRAKSTFLASMSHEIRTPMIGVTGMLEILEQTPMSSEQQHMVEVAQGSAQILLQIIGDILDFSKIEAGKLELAPRPVRLRSLVEVAAQTFFHTASAKGILLTWETDDRLAEAHICDALRIRQILSNLLSNAVKFTDEGTIVLSVRVCGDRPDRQQVEFTVQDTGPGVAAEQLAQLFQEFQQADSAKTQRGLGTGLGLVICRHLAALMGGKVTMESEVGHGTTVCLALPLVVADPSQVPEATRSGAVGARRSKPTRPEAEREGSVLLLAEDHPVNRQVLMRQLDMIGFHVDVAEDGAIAFERFVARRYGAVLTDLNMPGMNGYELTKAIRDHERTTGDARTPIVALTANALQGEAERCLAAGMDDFATKPTSMPVLSAKLRRWLGHLSWEDDERTDERTAVGPVAPAVILERDALANLADGDTELAATILADFVASARDDLDALRAAVAARDRGAIARRAHQMRGASLVVGAHQMAEAAGGIEMSARAGDAPDGLNASLAELDKALRAVAELSVANKSSHPYVLNG
jgi:signal transduction histidine kinase/CheY-like chemotaxis protein/HPt (histidine-containing phosphotransfer) domain-containing protein